MVSNPKISIIVPAYNSEAYLPKCLDSILAQTYENIEVIVINDGSTDGTGKLLDRYAKKDSRLTVIHQENAGVTKARFAGVRKSSGEWIGFIDGDDYIDEDMYSRLINNAITHNADISHCGYQMIFPNSIQYYYNTGKIILQDNMKGLVDLLDGSLIEPGLCNKIYRKSLFIDLLQGDIEDLNIKINEDLLINYNLFKQSSKSVYEDFCPYHYIIRRGSATTTRKPQLYLDPLRVRRKIYEETKAISELSSISYSRYIYMLINACTQTKFKDVSKTCVKELRENCKKGLKLDSKKLKIMAYTVAYFRPIYVFVRKIYDKIKSFNHDRDVD